MSQIYYEMMYILRPDLPEEQVRATVDKYRDLLAALGGESIDIQTRGKRRLAYPIKKNFDGIYVQMNYIAPGDHVAKIERDMRLSDEVIRYLTLKLDEKTEKVAKAEPEAAPEAEPEAKPEAEPEMATEPASEATPETVEA